MHLSRISKPTGIVLTSRFTTSWPLYEGERAADSSGIGSRDSGGVARPLRTFPALAAFGFTIGHEARGVGMVDTAVGLLLFVAFFLGPCKSAFWN